MTKLLISDTAEVTIKRKSDGRVFGMAETQLASISQSLGINEKLYGGIGNKPLAVMKGQKEVTATIRNLFYDQEFLAMSQGAKIESGTATVYSDEKGLKVTDNGGVLSVTIKGDPIEDVAYVTNTRGETLEAVISDGTITVPEGHAAAGELVMVRYREDVTGDIVKIDGDKFGEAFYIEYRTIGYNPDTNVVEKDIYIKIFHAVPSGDFELSFENGTALAPEITFDALTEPNTEQIAEVVEKKRTA